MKILFSFFVFHELNPLLLAIKKNYSEIVKILVQQPRINVNVEIILNIIFLIQFQKKKKKQCLNEI